MLIKGDLVKVPQGTVVISTNTPESLSVVPEPEYAVVVDASQKKTDEITVLLNGGLYEISRRRVQLVEKANVH